MITPEGDYLSNLKAPDLRPYFKHLTWRVMPHSMGHLVASDWADKADYDPVFGLYKKCGLWTRDEAAILWKCAQRSWGGWVDIGCHTGWTTAHILSGKPTKWTHAVTGIDPLLRVEEVADRCRENIATLPGEGDIDWEAETSQDWFAGLNARNHPGLGIRGFCIDGDHEPGKPLEDAQNAAKHLAETGVILFHDFTGQPVREAVTWLMDQGFKARVYWTPHIVCVCWRGDFTPPIHVPDQRIDWTPHLLEMAVDFDFRRLS